MKFSLWNGIAFIQASDDVNKLKTNSGQIRAWYENMSHEPPLSKLTIRDNAKDSVLYEALFRPGAAIRWKNPV